MPSIIAEILEFEKEKRSRSRGEIPLGSSSFVRHYEGIISFYILLRKELVTKNQSAFLGLFFIFTEVLWTA